ncbi:ankyrin repeat domain-containing protein [Avibacterium paragallinarum]|uniref:ankyrin repeat domain-containing protein n=1 Tax=Avibacterium paragallinarum TaxID=728 RepID=UPI0039879AAB
METIGEEIVAANWKGDIDFLNEVFTSGKEDILKITPGDKWNWLHRSNLLRASPVDVIKFYIKKGVPVNAQDIYGMTPLHYAMRAKNGDAAIALLEAGADPNIPNQDNLRPLSMIGYMPNRLDILEMMLDKGANVDNIINENETILESYNPKKYPFLNGEIYSIMKPYSKE